MDLFISTYKSLAKFTHIDIAQSRDGECLIGEKVACVKNKSAGMFKFKTDLSDFPEQNSINCAPEFAPKFCL